MNHDRQLLFGQRQTHVLRHCIVMLLLLMANVASAQVDAESSPSPRPDDEARNKAVVIGTAIITVIAVAGLTMICLIAVWGRRLRRNLRQPLPNQSRGDELWYLKPKKQVAVESAEDFDDSDATPE